MYSLPKVVLDDDRQELRDNQSQQPQGDSNMKQKHSTPLSPSQQKLLTALKKNFDISDNLEKKITFADSIATLYQEFELLDSAALYYHKIADLKPGLETWKNAGQSYYEAFEFYAVVDASKSADFKNKAQSFFEKILKQQPDDLNTQARMAMTLVSSDNPMQGILKLREIIEKDPDNEFVLLNLGLLSMQTGQFEKAKDRFEHLLSVAPDNNQTKVLLSQCYVNLNKSDKAIKLLNEVVQTEKDSVLKSSAETFLKTLKK